MPSRPAAPRPETGGTDRRSIPDLALEQLPFQLHPAVLLLVREHAQQFLLDPFPFLHLPAAKPERLAGERPAGFALELADSLFLLLRQGQAPGHVRVAEGADAALLQGDLPQP